MQSTHVIEKYNVYTLKFLTVHIVAFNVETASETAELEILVRLKLQNFFRPPTMEGAD